MDQLRNASRQCSSFICISLLFGILYPSCFLSQPFLFSFHWCLLPFSFEEITKKRRRPDLGRYMVIYYTLPSILYSAVASYTTPSSVSCPSTVTTLFFNSSSSSSSPSTYIYMHISYKCLTGCLLFCCIRRWIETSAPLQTHLRILRFIFIFIFYLPYVLLCFLLCFVLLSALSSSLSCSLSFLSFLPPVPNPLDGLNLLTGSVSLSPSLCALVRPSTQLVRPTSFRRPRTPFQGQQKSVRQP